MMQAIQEEKAKMKFDTEKANSLHYISRRAANQLRHVHKAYD